MAVVKSNRHVCVSVTIAVHITLSMYLLYVKVWAAHACSVANTVPTSAHTYHRVGGLPSTLQHIYIHVYRLMLEVTCASYRVPF